MLQVRGDPVPRVQWCRDGMELNDPRFEAHFDGSQRCTLTIQELRDGDSGRYMCEATNRVGRVSTFARLFIVNDPKILEADHKLKRWVNIMMSAVHVSVQRSQSEGKEPTRCDKVCSFIASTWQPKSGRYLLIVLLMMGILVSETC
jgi:hypothetical protein